MDKRCLIRFALSVIVLAIASPAWPQGGVLARAQLATITNTAKNLAPDAQLLFITTPIEINISGQSHEWTFLLKSSSQQKLYEFIFDNGSLSRVDPLTIPQSQVHIGMDTLPGTFIDSDSALAVAERRGGKMFRSRNSEYFIEATLFPAGTLPGPGHAPVYMAPTWVIRYEGPNGDFRVSINAVSGQPWRPVVARQSLPFLNALAARMAVDATLILIESPYTQPNGKSNDWFYVYYSKSKFAFYEFKLEDAHVRHHHLVSYDLTFLQSLSPLPDSWVDSWKVMQVAENNGGGEYRSKSNNAQIQILLAVGEVRVSVDRMEFFLPPHPRWQVTYTSDGYEELLIFVETTSGIPYDPTKKLTAKQRLTTVDSLAAISATDARLVKIVSPAVDPTGHSYYWSYVYTSALNNSFYEFILFGSQLLLKNNQFEATDPLLYSDIPALPRAWIDSDSALTVAEQNGGKEFRNQNSNNHIDVLLITIEQELPIERPTWFIFYTDPNGAELRPSVDALIGTTYNNLPRATARQRFSKIDSLAHNISDDAHLVYARGNLMDEKGSSDRWRYIYESASLDSLMEFWSLGGHAVFAGKVTLAGIQPDMPAILDDWIDSDSALILAEKQGGQDFRAQFSDWRLDMSLKAPNPGFQVLNTFAINADWIVFYRRFGGNESKRFTIKASAYHDSLQVTAKAKLSDIETMAKEIASDARLIGLNGVDIDSSGKSDAWTYIFKSMTTEKIFDIVYYQGIVGYRETDPNRGWSLSSTPLPNDWEDSDQVLPHAEQAGGDQFRSTHNGCIADGTLHAFTESFGDQAPVTIVKAMWNIYYNAPDGAFLGVANDAMASFTALAEDSLTAVQTMAMETVADAELVCVIGFDLDEKGKSSVWRYIFQSVDQNTLFECLYFQGQLYYSPAITLGYLAPSLDASALPARWANSEIAIAVAEQKGGTQFRATHTDCNIDCRLWVTKEGPQWEFYYNSSVGSKVLIVDGLTPVQPLRSSLDIPERYSLEQNFPNPFNLTTTIGLDLVQRQDVRIRIIDLLGREIALLVDKELMPGSHQVIWDGRNRNGEMVSSGIYLYEMVTESYRQVRRMVLVK